MLAAVAAYYPLHSIAMAQTLLTLDWPEPVAGLVRQQVREPMEEAQRSRIAIPVLTAVEGQSASLQVTQQYEENPYPRLDDQLSGSARRRQAQGRSGSADGSRADKEILIAGCGTGKQAFYIA